jgi:predicted flap endonuclease-1-like 5' DNA nuclease
MAKKAKPSVDKIVKKVNKEFEKTSSQIEGLISDALRQFDSLQSQIEEPVRKLLKEVNELREREMKRFHEEFDRRLTELQEFQKAVLERLGIAAREAESEVKSVAEQTKAAVPTGTKPAPKAAAKPKTGTRSSTAAKTGKKPLDKGDLTRVKGIGPATAKKMKAAGITSIDQIANPSAEDREKLKAFKSLKGYSQLSAEAKKLL